MVNYDVNKATKLSALKILAEEVEKSLDKLSEDVKNLEIPEDTIKKIADESINEWAQKTTDNGTIDTIKEVIDYVASHGETVAKIIADIQKNAGAIEDLESLVGEEGVSEQIANVLKGYVKKDGNKVLSTNDYTNADKEKLDGIEFASDEEVLAMLNEVFATDD